VKLSVCVGVSVDVKGGLAVKLGVTEALIVAVGVFVRVWEGVGL
jgi:hypothetical protein